MEMGLSGVSHHLRNGYRAREAHIHPSVSATCHEEEYGPAVDQRWCSKVSEGLERGGLSRQWSIRNQATDVRAPDESLSLSPGLRWEVVVPGCH